MQRVALGRPARARTFLEDAEGHLITDGDVHLTVTSDRTGATHVDDQPAAYTAAGWSHDLPAAAVAELDVLHVGWTYTGFTWATEIEVAGGVLFSLGRARADKKLEPKDASFLEDARVEAERAIESRCGYAFVPRYSVVPARRRGDRAVLDVVHVRELVAARVDGAPVTGAAFHALSVSAAGVARGLCALPDGDVELALEHGLDRPPGGAEEACLLLAANAPLGDRNPRLVRRGHDNGSFEVYYSQDAELGAFDIPAVEAFCRRVERSRVV